MQRILIVGGALALLLFMSCSSSKRKKDVSKLGKFYHNTTAKYNGYFNANELVEASIRELSQGYNDNYNQLLSIQKWEGPENKESQFSKLDTAIKKVSVVAALHTPSKWTDDCYLLAGKAQYIKGEYEAAENTLLYTIAEFDPSNPSSRYWEYNRDEIREAKQKKKKEKRKKRQKTKKKKIKEKKKSRKQQLKDRKKSRKKRSKKRRPKTRKERERREAEQKRKQKEAQQQREMQRKAEKEKQAIAKNQKAQKEEESNPLYKPEFDADQYTKGGHTPAFQEAQLWLSKTYIKRDQFFNAQNLLRKLQADESMDNKLKEQVYVASAQLYIAQNKLSDAISNLKNALNLGKDRNQNARYAFVIAQLYERLRDRASAGQYFADAKKFSNQYEMEFTSDLKSISNLYNAGQISKRNTFDQLEKMLHDGKNKEYKGQIYFVMYQIAKESGDDALARTYLNAALQNRGSNSSIALEAYHEIAATLYENGKYLLAKLYYDSTMQFMQRSDKRFHHSKQRHIALTELADANTAYQTNDSLLAIAEMPEDKRMALAEEILAQRAEAQRKALEAQKEAQPSQNTNIPVAGGLESNFFAYNPKRIEKGRIAFEQRFGNRPLVDNWRTVSDFDIQEQEENELNEIEEAFANKTAEEKLNEAFGNYPKTERQVIAVKQKITDALYKLGEVYRDQLDRPDLAVPYLEELVTQYPRYTVDENAIYRLVLMGRELNRPELENTYTQLLQQRYPKSDYNKILKDPNYLKQLEEKNNAVEEAYTNAYTAFQKGQYAMAAQLADNSAKRYNQNNTYLPKFKLLEAMAKGKTEGKQKYINELRILTKAFQGTPEATKAEEIIRFLNGNENAFVKREGQMGDFVLEEDKLHYVVIPIFNGKNVDIQQVKIQITDFNKKYFSLKRLRASSIFLDLNKGIPLIIVRNFDNKEDAMKYYQTAKQYSEEYLDKDVKYEIFASSQRNYRNILKERSIEPYRPFFEKYYIRAD